MKSNSIQKYRRFKPVDLPDREWPDQVIKRAPIWCSVDLRDGNQALPIPMNVSQKLRMFDTLVKCGFKEIEVGFPSASNTEFEFNRRLIDEERIPEDVTVQVLVQAREDLIERTIQSLKGARKAIIHLYNSTSPAQREYVFRMSKKQIVEVAIRGAKMIQERLDRLDGTEVKLQYSPESFSATEVEFSKEVAEAVMDVWKPSPERKMILNLPETVQLAMPNVYADQIEWICRRIRDRESLIVSLHTHNDRGTGTASTEMGLLAGADRVEGTLFGNGERTGNLDIVQVALNLYMHGIEPGLDFCDINSLIEVYEQCTGLTLPARQPYSGELVFTAFSGSHQDAIKKGLAAWNLEKNSWDVPYLTIDPADIGREYREIIRVNSQSGKGGVAFLLESEFGIELPKEFQREFGPLANDEVDRLGREVSANELKEIFWTEYIEQTNPLALRRFHADGANDNYTAWSTISLSETEKDISGRGNGPIDAFVDALVKDVGIPEFSVDDYREGALTAGADAQAIAFIKISQAGGDSCWGAGVDTNTEYAAVRAVISALNRAYPWVALQLWGEIIPPKSLRLEFAQLAPEATPDLFNGGLESRFLEIYALKESELTISITHADFGADGGCACQITRIDDGETAEGWGLSKPQAICDALSKIFGVKAEIRDVFDDYKTQQMATSRRSGKPERIAFVVLRLEPEQEVWGMGLSPDSSEEAVFRALQTAFVRYSGGQTPTISITPSMKNKKHHRYPFETIEPKWQALWEDEKTYKTPNPGDADFDPDKPKYYVLDMFPYPSGSGLHVGHPEGYTATDIIARYKRMTGHNVLHPMGWDAFGLPAEQHAIKTGEHPSINTRKNVDNFRRQLKRLGFSYDWDREVNTTDPNYVKWTQWIFLQLYNSYFDEEAGKAKPVAELDKNGWNREQIDDVRLAFVSEAPVNWSPTLGTVLANEEVDEWKEKGEVVERRPLRQWNLRITAYAQRLIDELDGLDWPEGIKEHQRNWIGRSEGAEVTFKVRKHRGRKDYDVTVFTTRPDTLFGATYMVLAPEHPLVDKITSNEQTDAVDAYRKEIAAKSDLDRTDLAKDKSGVFTGGFGINPVNGEKIPVWIADYVLMSYGTGAIMAVPAHDDRDYEFAQKFDIPIIEVVQAPDDFEGTCFTGEGVAINSGILDGMPTNKAKKKITEWLESEGAGKKTINYKLRDWLFSRQRYWGEPFPIVWKDGKHEAIGEDELPLIQPNMDDFKPTGSPEGPLAKAKDWLNVGKGAKRETNTMPQWAGSCWYYLRYIDAENPDAFVGDEAEKYWMGGGRDGGVDLYVGGSEHAVLHLLYARFWHKVLNDLGHVSTIEPFQRLVNQGLIMGEDGQKMSKSRGNVVNPDDVVEAYGADSLRLFEMFMGPLEQVKPWSTKGVEGVNRFLAKVWRLVMEETQEGDWVLSDSVADIVPTKAQLKVVHATIKKVGEDIEAMAFNTAISQMMVCTNELGKADPLPVSCIAALLHVLNPFAPHLSDELNEQLRARFPDKIAKSLVYEPWPQFDETYLVEDEIEMVIQVNGKVRDKMSIDAKASKEACEEQAKQSVKVQSFIDGLTVRKVIVVPKKLVNIVAN